MNKIFKDFLADLLTKDTIIDYLFIVSGCIIQAIGMVFFLIPSQLISGGISGLAQVINHYTYWPIGLLTLAGNIPLLILGWRYLGRIKFAARTIFAVTTFSVFTDLLSSMAIEKAITHDLFLNTMFGAVILGLGFGLVYKGSGTSGGSDIIGRILNQRIGLPIAQSYLLTDSVSVILGGIAFGWDLALYGLIAIYISGFAAEMISEGSSYFRDVIIITSQPDKIAEDVINILDRSVTHIKGVGGFSGEEKTIIYCVIGRNEVNQLKKMVVEADPSSFMVVGHAHEVLGEGFQKYKSLT
ncbi:MAG: YitT family protein [Flexilinea sp.]